MLGRENRNEANAVTLSSNNPRVFCQGQHARSPERFRRTGRSNLEIMAELMSLFCRTLRKKAFFYECVL